jgi:hypothetical protein
MMQKVEAWRTDLRQFPVDSAEEKAGSSGRISIAQI